MRMLPGSHLAGQQSHEKGETAGNLLSNGQKIAMDIDESKAIDIVVPAGSASFHHTHIVHSSGPNNSHDRRIGIGISYIPTRVRFLGEGRVPAALVCGKDSFGHFDPEMRPKTDLDDAARQFHAEACDRFLRATVRNEPKCRQRLAKRARRALVRLKHPVHPREYDRSNRNFRSDRRGSR